MGHWNKVLKILKEDIWGNGIQVKKWEVLKQVQAHMKKSQNLSLRNKWSQSISLIQLKKILSHPQVFLDSLAMLKSRDVSLIEFNGAVLRSLRRWMAWIVTCSGFTLIWESWKLRDQIKVFLILQVQKILHRTKREVKRRWTGE